jgi:hypothetical protein
MWKMLRIENLNDCSRKKFPRAYYARKLEQAPDSPRPDERNESRFPDFEFGNLADPARFELTTSAFGGQQSEFPRVSRGWMR